MKPRFDREQPIYGWLYVVVMAVDGKLQQRLRTVSWAFLFSSR